MVTELTKDNFETLTDGVIDFWATWCGPCRMLSPILDEIAGETGITVGKVNTDEQPEIAGAFEIEVIPTLIFVKNGQVVGRISGYRPKNELQAIIERALA